MLRINNNDDGFFNKNLEYDETKILNDIFKDSNNQIEKKARMHMLGSKVKKVGKTRKSIKKGNGNRKARKRKFCEIRNLKKSLRSKIEILKVQKLERKIQDWETERENHNGDTLLPETHHKKYLKHILFLLKSNLKIKKKTEENCKNTLNWKFAWVNFSEYTKSEDSVSYFHQRILNLPQRYIKKDLYNKLSFLKQKKKKEKK